MMKISTKNYFYYKHQKFGQLKFRQINFNDLIKIEKFKVIRKRYRNFTIFVLHNQIVSPKIDISDFSILDNKEIISIAKYFIKMTVIFSKYFKEAEGEAFFINFYNSYKNYRKELSKSFAPLGEIYEQISKKVAEAFRSSSKLVQISIAPISEFIIKMNEEVGKNMAEAIQKIKIATDDAGRILIKYEWPFPPSIDIRAAILISNLGNKPGNHREEINKVFLDYYQRDNFKEIELMINRWKSNKLFRRRIKILKDCLKILQLSKENCSFNSANVITPTLIAQIDGVWTDYVKSKGFDIRKYSKKELSKELMKYKKNKIKMLKTSNSFATLDDLFKNVILETLFGTAYPGFRPETGNIPSRFNRHKILHGEYVSYGSIYNVLRAFFLLDLLDFISELK